MKLKRLVFVALSAILAVVCVMFAACAPESEQQGGESTFTVTYVDATADNAVLDTEEVASGGKATRWEPEKEGYDFVNWYATPSLSHVFDFEQTISQDTTVYGYFVSSEFVADTRDFFIMGTSSDENSVLFNTEWKIGDAGKQQLSKSGAQGVNEYTITVDLYAGDAFQFAINDDFENQRGYGYLVDGADAYFDSQPNYLDPDPLKANILVNTAGNYTFTLTTHPWSDEYDTGHLSYTEETKENFNYNLTDTISFVRNGDPLVSPSEEVLEIRVKGSYITGWDHITTPEYTMQYDEENDVYTYSHEFVAGDAFMFYNFTTVIGEDGQPHTSLGSINLNTDRVDKENSDVEYLDLTPASNIVTKASGTYSFVYDRNTNLLTIKYSPEFTSGYTHATTWYITGGGITEPLKSSQYGNNLTEDHLFEKTGEYEYSKTVDLAVGDIFQVVMSRWYGGQHGYSSFVEPEKGGVVYFSLSGDKTNARVEVSGNYTITLTLDPESPLGDKITWVRNGDIIQDLPVAYDVFMKSAPDEGSDWIISERHSTGTGESEGIVEFRAMLTEGRQFCFIYYDPGVPDDEVGSYNNPGSLVTGFMKGTEGGYNANFGVFENNFVCNVAGFYVIRIDFTGGTPVVDFIEYQEVVPEFEAIIKGNALAVGWDGSERYQSEDGRVVMVVEFIKTGETTLSDGQFGFAWWDDSVTTSYGNWIGVSCMGTSGDANSLFVSSADNNNFVASVTGTYMVVIDMSGGTPVVDFYSPDWEVIVKGTAFDVGWDGTDRLPVFGDTFELEYEFIEGGEFGFTLYGKTVTNQYGDYVGWAYMGTDGDANSLFEQQAGGGNNIICKRGGVYKIVIDMSGDDYVVNFYTVS